MKRRLTTWFDVFLTVYQKHHITPYIHVFVCHVPELLHEYGSICQFTQQGLEKFNDVTTKSYFRSTNHRKGSALMQIMHKQNRLETLEGEHTLSQMLKSQGMTCSVCTNRGHSSRTCKANEL
ncbi:hypothetical protein HOLleu_03411 [Holothuria leucospilota]|uniref:Uncharacterized protein n=1 Tax=Holothuria leucospilota TaxID=206669 RepID=A0A9Q1CTF2_HOLLE|nr:hypothetical protein HOLleu_03411 [Holothuria leucospilota]